MTSNYISVGVDLDNYYAPHVTSSASFATGYSVAGQDFANRYDVLSSPALINASCRLPPQPGYNISASGYPANTNPASIFCGNTLQYPETQEPNSYDTQVLTNIGFSLDLDCGVTWNNASDMANYFYYGGRILLSANLTGYTTAPSAALAAFLSSIGNHVIYEYGNFNMNNGSSLEPNTGAMNTTDGFGHILYNVNQPSPYSANFYEIIMGTPTPIGAPSSMTFTIQCSIQSDNYDGIYMAGAKQKKYPTQANGTFIAHFE